MPTMNLSEKHVNDEKDNHSLLTVCERAEVSSPSGVKQELPKKMNRRDETMCRCNKNRDNVNDILMQEKINSDYTFQNNNEWEKFFNQKTFKDWNLISHDDKKVLSKSMFIEEINALTSISFTIVTNDIKKNMDN